MGRCRCTMEPTPRTCRVHNLDIKREAVSVLAFIHDQCSLNLSCECRLIWNLCLTRKSAIQHALHSHYRAITDINWHTQDPDVVVSTGIDSWLWAWDLRTPQKPIMGQSMSDANSYLLSNCLIVKAFALLMVCTHNPLVGISPSHSCN